MQENAAGRLMIATSMEEDESEGLKNENVTEDKCKPVYVDLDKPVE